MLGAGQARVLDTVGEIQGQQVREEQEQASHLGGELPSVGECELLHVGHSRHERTVLGVVTGLRHGPAPLSLGGQAFTLQQTKKIGFADAMAFGVQLGANGGERVALANSEMLPAGTWFDCELRLLEPVKGTKGTDYLLNMELVRECLDYGQLKGLGQWRSGSWGRYSWEELKAK